MSPETSLLSRQTFQFTLFGTVATRVSPSFHPMMGNEVLGKELLKRDEANSAELLNHSDYFFALFDHVKTNETNIDCGDHTAANRFHLHR